MKKLDEDIVENNDCFIIMPISDPEGYEKGHFRKVYEDIFQVACNDAGFEAVRADEVKQTNLIHLDILQKLIDSPMAICDLSSRNPNVLFELGLRQAFDMPTVLVQECGTPQIFDISPLRFTEYRKELRYREVLEDQSSISQAIKATKEATDKGDGVNSIIGLLSILKPAALKEVTENDNTKLLQMIMSEMNSIRTDIKKSFREVNKNRNGFMSGDSTIEEQIIQISKLYENLLYMIESKESDSEISHQYNLLRTKIISLNSISIPSDLKNLIELVKIKSEELYHRNLNDLSKFILYQ